jgi:hypothetical protein
MQTFAVRSGIHDNNLLKSCYGLGHSYETRSTYEVQRWIYAKALSANCQVLEKQSTGENALIDAFIESYWIPRFVNFRLY